MPKSPEEVSADPTGRTGLPADVVAHHQRERLLAATIELVAKRGYRGTSIDHIVKSARVGYVAFYDLFEGKKDCFLAAFDQIVAEARGGLIAALPTQASWPELIVAALRNLIEMIDRDPARARVALVEVHAAGPAAYARYEEMLDSFVPKLREGRELSPVAATLSGRLEEAIVGGVAWIVHQRLVRGETDRIRALLPEGIEIALSPYLGEAEAHRFAAECGASAETPTHS